MERGVQDRIAELRAEVTRELAAARPVPKPVARGRRAVRTRVRWKLRALGVLTIVAAVALPFVLYARASVMLSVTGWHPWGAVAAAAALTLGVVALYGWWLARRLPGGRTTRRIVLWILVPLALTWCGYASLYLARTNAKSEAVRRYYGSVHPVLRVALATAILADPGLVLTDAARVPADYARMGLPVNDRTRHYRQPDGWVHAVDLRTIGRGELRNRMLQLWFELLGFSTLRHVGTADHLHVQLARSR